MKGNVYTHVLIIILLVAISGCATNRPPQVHMSAMAKYRDICTVAVLPFLNETSQKTAGMQAMRIFTNELIASGNYQVIPEGEIAFFMQRNRLLPIDLLNSDLYSKLARKLALDAVIRGRVMSLGQQQNVGGLSPISPCRSICMQRIVVNLLLIHIIVGRETITRRYCTTERFIPRAG